jgi:hypothetical protein
MILAMTRMMLVASLLVLAACASYRTTEQRTTQGPLAEDLWMTSVILANGREPNFDERRHWNNQMEYKISQYLHKNPDAANSLDVSTFRFVRQVSVGQTAEQVVILLGPPRSKTTDEAEMEKLARGYWPSIKGNVSEVWVYPAGWRLYFKDSKLIDITQYLVP